MKIVVRAGGIGTRLWPISRQANPKQFGAFVGEQSMIKDSFERVKLAVAAPTDIFVSVNLDHLAKLKAELPALPAANIITETDVRNTGPAMCLEVCFLEASLPPETVVASLPSDDYISNAEAFADLLALSEGFIKEHPDYILTPAVRPAYLDTGYSYMKSGQLLAEAGEEAIYQVADVVEKPNADYCQELIDSGVYYCHTGMYIWQLGNIAGLFRQYQPAMYELCRQVVSLMAAGAPWSEVKALYAQAEKMSIESAITDKAAKIAMSVSDRIGWSDLGKWHIIKRMLSDKPEDNLLKGKVVANEAKGNLVYATDQRRLIVINDVDNLVIVDTPDALYISSADKSAEVKTCLEKAADQGWQQYL